jgi:membrane fusion protein (multidrug efflux system)
MTPRNARPEKKPSTTKRMIIMLILAGVLLGGLFAVKAMMSAGMNQFFDNMPQPAVAVTATEVVQRTWPQSLDAVGTLVAVNGTDVTTESPGVIRTIRFESGQRVKKGDLLLQLDATAESATLASMEAALKLAITQRDRYRELFSTRQAVARADLDQRESEAERLQADVAAQRALIARKSIRAPFDGVLGIRKVNLGQYINPGDAIVSLQMLDPIHLNFSLPEQEVSRVSVGQAVTATVDALQGQRFNGTITAIESLVDASTRNFLVQATLENPDEVLRPGTFARVSSDLGEALTALAVPQTAVTFNPYGNSVFVITEVARQPGETDMMGNPLVGNKLVAQQRFIRTGATRGDLVAVVEGLDVGERVATSGLLKLRNDAEVTINNKVQPSAEESPEPANR